MLSKCCYTTAALRASMATAVAAQHLLDDWMSLEAWNDLYIRHIASDATKQRSIHVTQLVYSIIL